MAKGKGPFSALIALAVWITGVLVSLAVGFGMVNEVLTLPSWLGGSTVAMVAGWIVVVLTLVSVVLAIIEKFK